MPQLKVLKQNVTKTSHNTVYQSEIHSRLYSIFYLYFNWLTKLLFRVHSDTYGMSGYTPTTKLTRLIALIISTSLEEDCYS
jgi:hypothetical protein